MIWNPLKISHRGATTLNSNDLWARRITQNEHGTQLRVDHIPAIKVNREKSLQSLFADDKLVRVHMKKQLRARYL
jgi:hypothetical protein